MNKLRLAVVVTHPIQYYSPLWRALAQVPTIALHVIFASRVGLDKTFDVEMKTTLAWAPDLVGGYSHEFLPEAASILRVDSTLDNPSVGSALSRFRPDAVVIHGYGSRTMLRALIWCKIHGASALLTADSSAHVSRPGWRRILKMAVLPRLLRLYNAALTMGDRSEAHFAALGFPKDRMFRTPVMIDELFWRARDARSDLRASKRAELGLSPAAFVLMAASKLTKGKRIADLIDACARLKPAPIVLIVGEGAERDRLEAFAASKGVDARFFGFVNIDLMPAYYAAADVFIHVGEVEQYGMVALEAAILGLPMALSDQTGAVGPTSIARPGENTVVFPVGDVEAIARAIDQLRDEKTRWRMTEASLSISEDHRGPKSVAGVLAAAAGALKQ